LVLKNAMPSFNELKKLEKHTFLVLTHYNELNQHVNLEDMEKDLEKRPTRFIREVLCVWRENKSIPDSNS